MGKTTHGMYHSPEYKVWASMKNRCSDSNHWSGTYKDISVCERWDSFNNFIEDMGERPDTNYELDRINNDGDYEPGNCQWILKEYNLKKRSNAFTVSINGEDKTLTDLGKEYGISRQALYQRYKRGLRGESLIKPQSKRGRKKHSRASLFWFLTLKN